MSLGNLTKCSFESTSTFKLEKKKATHSSILAWRIPWMGEPGGLLSMGSHRVGHNWSNLACNFLSIYGYLLCARLDASTSDARVNKTGSIDCSIMCVTDRCRSITFVLASPSRDTCVSPFKKKWSQTIHTITDLAFLKSLTFFTLKIIFQQVVRLHFEIQTLGFSTVIK